MVSRNTPFAGHYLARCILEESGRHFGNGARSSRMRESAEERTHTPRAPDFAAIAVQECSRVGSAGKRRAEYRRRPPLRRLHLGRGATERAGADSRYGLRARAERPFAPAVPSAEIT